MVEEHGFIVSGGDPLTFFVPNAGGTFQTADGTNGTAFLSGGTLKIDKDEAGSQYTYHGFLGTTNSAFGFGTGPGELSPDQLAAENSNVDQLAGSVGTTLDVPFSNFYGSQNGTQIKGATLASGDRGSWLGGTAGYVPWIVGITGSATLPNPDTGSEIVAGIVTTANASDIAGEFRSWDQSVYLAGQDPGNEHRVDMIRSREHGCHWLAYVLIGSTDTLRWKRTHDKWHNDTGGTIYTAMGSRNNSPNIAWSFGQLTVIWHDGTDIRRAFSNNMGEGWGTSVSLSITGTNPRLLVDTDTGFAWLFYVTAGKLYVQRSGNLFAEVVDASPILVVDPIDKQAIAAQLCLDGSLVIQYVVAGAVTQARSSDLGRTWSA
jgi:hypothetical protein